MVISNIIPDTLLFRHFKLTHKIIESVKRIEAAELEPQSEKKAWVTPNLEIISTDDILSGDTPGHPEGKRVGPTTTYHS